MDGKSGSNGRGGTNEVRIDRETYGGGNGATGAKNVGGGARLTVAEGMVLHEAYAGETTVD